MMSASFDLPGLASQYNVSPETVQAAVDSLRAAIGHSPTPAAEALQPPRPVYLDVPEFEWSDSEESAEFDRRLALHEEELKPIEKHNSDVLNQHHLEDCAYQAYLAYLDYKEIYDAERSTHFPKLMEIAKRAANTEATGETPLCHFRFVRKSAGVVELCNT